MKKEVQAVEGLDTFLNQFGENSIYKKILLEVFFEELLNAETISLSGEKGQEGNKINNDLAIENKDKSNEIT